MINNEGIIWGHCPQCNGALDYESFKRDRECVPALKECGDNISTDTSHLARFLSNVTFIKRRDTLTVCCRGCGTKFQELNPKYHLTREKIRIFNVHNLQPLP